MSLFLFIIILSLFFISLFFLLSKLNFNDFYLSSSFECGFSSYFFSRFSFSIHYFLIGLIFLFLDLEVCLCFFFFFFFFFDLISDFMVFFFAFMLFGGLFLEILDSKISWFD